MTYDHGLISPPVLHMINRGAHAGSCLVAARSIHQAEFQSSVRSIYLKIGQALSQWTVFDLEALRSVRTCSARPCICKASICSLAIVKRSAVAIRRIRSSTLPGCVALLVNTASLPERKRTPLGCSSRPATIHPLYRFRSSTAPWIQI
jgi:hypothetical protein